ncbi:MAG: hypothetical protein MK066_12230 [Crocinitomicaceae bacterium]|nr:hypothetical protein [Crocinitomicaceae bacterium]
MMNKFKGLLCLSAFLMLGSFGFGQLELGGDDKKEKKKKEVKDVKVVQTTEKSDTEIYLFTNWSNTFSDLSENEGLYGDDLGEREFESSLNTWSYGLGFRSRLNDFLIFEGGVSLTENGESYSFVGTDTAYSYKTKYTYFSMPLKVVYYHDIMFDNNTGITFFAGAGLMPQMFSRFKQDIEITNSENTVTNETVERRDETSTFVLSAVFNIGIQYQFMNNWSLMFIPEYRRHITDSYTEFDSYDHFGRALGFNVGISMGL